MDKEKQKAAIAMACGIGQHLECPKCDTWFEATPGKDYKYGVFCPECRSRGYTLIGICRLEFDDDFDPLNDLNHIYKAVETLRFKSGPEWFDFGKHLMDICGSVSNAINATAEQKAEAFLRAVGKWENSEKIS